MREGEPPPLWTCETINRDSGLPLLEPRYDGSKIIKINHCCLFFFLFLNVVDY